MDFKFMPKDDEMEKYIDSRLDRLKKISDSEKGFKITDSIMSLFGNKYATVGFFESIAELNEENGTTIIAVMVWLSLEVEKRLKEKDKTIESLQYALDELMRSGVNGNKS